MKLVPFILLFLLLSLYCIRSNKHLVNIWTMSTMWRLMLTWGIILELLNNQSQTSHRRIHYAWNSWAVSCEHLDQFQCWYWHYLTTVPTWRMILGRLVSQSWSSWPVSMTSRLTTVPTWRMILEQSNSQSRPSWPGSMRKVEAGRRLIWCKRRYCIGCQSAMVEYSRWKKQTK